VLSLALLVAAGLLAVFFAHIYERKRQRYLLFWATGWCVLALHYLLPALAPWTGEGAWQAPVNAWLLAVAVLLFFAAAQSFTQKQPSLRLTAAGAAAFAVWAAAHHFGYVQAPSSFGVAFLLFGIGWVFWRESRNQETLAEGLLTASFVVWGLLLLAGVFRARMVALFDAQDDPMWAHLLATAVLIPQMMIAVLMVMAVYEEEKRRVERNMLALSNLNLATSGIVGGEIQRMLAQALDRMLSVVRIPSGALLLHHGDPSGPKTVVAAGMSEQFCQTIQDEHLDDHLVELVARLGGLVVFQDLARDSAWGALEREEAFRQFRALMIREGFHTVAGISLQSKERVFGVLLLSTPDHRRFTPAELRLLLALGHQIGMAVENSYLIQQTARRSEELHILNEIGQTLSSTLDTETLFEKIVSEVRRLFDINNCYIAFYDSRRNELRFELEIVEGVRLPKRSRPVGNHLSEYIIRTRQPVLIRQNFIEETRKLGVEPLQQTGCFCGVPLLLYDRAIGVMGMHSTQEGTFDQGHLELLRILASQTSIAIENARLFEQEQAKSRQLTLLNNVSRHAITTLNPEEMLTMIVAEAEEGLPYDHIGVGVLEYESKEVVILAEAGKRRDALGRRIPLGTGLIGQVARSGEMLVVRDHEAGGGSGVRPLLPDSVAAAALPIVFADQLLGVFYVEHSAPCEFSDEERQLLRTLADLVAGALHSALSFQKAQEQAITDGLTGVKTHRFFMEALSAEWKRSTRAGRPFSLVLIDLDRFKFVNDFYGHLEGDIVLQRVGHILEQNCRRSDVVARYGGDEFVILMPETNIEQARQFAGKLRACVAADALLREKNITASFGAASFPIHGSTPQELIQVADASMYLSKHQGGNAVSTADHSDLKETQKWKRDVLEAYLGVTLKRLFSTGPEAFEEIYQRLEQFTQSLAEQDEAPPPDTEGAPRIHPAVIETLTSLATAIDAKDHFTRGHSQKVSELSALIAQELRLSPHEVEAVRLAGRLHDVGKVGIPEAILNKAGPLDAEEWEVMKSHTRLGARILEPLRTLGHIQRMVAHHHEFYDGSGYPEGLAGEQIPLGARIIAIADAYDTITSDRTYKKARSMEDALAELERCAGTQFDPELVRVFVSAMRERAGRGISPSPVRG
jgi:diguanylate cyclase (GGDEF)-like protein/putative nucleotidyltransferase with HDIG domain